MCRSRRERDRLDHAPHGKDEPILIRGAFDAD